MPIDNRPIIFDHEDEDWRQRARCRGLSPDLFHPERGESSTPSLKICFGCEVKAECLIEALEHPDNLGTWGYTSERKRRFLRKKLIQSGMSTRDFVLALPGYGYPETDKGK